MLFLIDLADHAVGSSSGAPEAPIIGSVKLTTKNSSQLVRQPLTSAVPLLGLSADILISVDIASLESSPVGSLVGIAGTDPNTGRPYNHFAFVPDPLPAVVQLKPETWTKVTEATGALGALRQACAHLPAPELLIHPTLAREAQATSALEGTHGAMVDVLEANLPGVTPPSPEVKEIRAYIDMAYYGFEWVAERPITMGLICDLQKILADNSKRKPAEPGHVRSSQVIIGPEGSSIYDARFIPPPGDDRLRSGIDQWNEWRELESPMPPIVLAAMSHYQFETLHPFTDCNGRVGRLLIILQFLGSGILEYPALTLSPWLLRRRSEYQDHLLRISQTGDWNGWVSFFSQAINEQAESHIAAADHLIRWRRELLTELSSRNWSGVISNIVQDLIEWPIVTARSVQERYSVSAPTAKSAIDRLVELGVLKELTGKTYDRRFGATEIMDVLERI